MSWLWAIILGLILGVIARIILPGRQPIPIWLTIVFGIIGSSIGNAAASGIGVGDTRGVDWIRHLLQLAGAVGAVALGTPVYEKLRGHKTRSPR
ncbi:GlsB/YeaQ/YmgE family stress response membrane protein [Streptomyces sp. B8F3]|uniref:GlsB/YeaQ/YmgE family stress response membrane protein n=1 Tax=unclassified Streptomyces TaxID=2593676 RepID=UPI00325D226D